MDCKNIVDVRMRLITEEHLTEVSDISMNVVNTLHKEPNALKSADSLE